MSQFPFPVHLPREGEPIFDPRISFLDVESSTPEVRDMRIAWTAWVFKQVDRHLLALEQELFDMWYITSGDIPDDYLEQVRNDQATYVQRMRENGYQALLDTYWPHLASLPQPY